MQILEARPGGFDAVLMDVQMPVLDGLTATRRIREELGLTRLPIIAFTAGVRDEQQAAARQAGANDVLPKPMDLEQMAVLLARWIADEAAETPSAATPDAPPATAPAAAENDDTGFPDIPGIDRQRAAQRLSRDRDMFLSLLELFVEDNARAPALAREALAQGDREGAARRMHTLRSNAGFLCALDLMENAGQLEKAIEQDEPDLDARLADLQQEIDALIAASAPWRAGVTA